MYWVKNTVLSNSNSFTSRWYSPEINTSTYEKVHHHQVMHASLPLTYRNFLVAAVSGVPTVDFRASVFFSVAKATMQSLLKTKIHYQPSSCFPAPGPDRRPERDHGSTQAKTFATPCRKTIPQSDKIATRAILSESSDRKIKIPRARSVGAVVVV